MDNLETVNQTAENGISRKKNYEVHIDVNNQNMAICGAGSKDNPKIMSGSANYLYLQFKFSEEWEEPKFAQFVVKGTMLPVEVKLENDGCYVPEEAVRTPGYFGISAYCEPEAVRRITVRREIIYVGESGYTESALPSSGSSPSNGLVGDVTTETTEPGTSASVEIATVYKKLMFRFSIPKGENGDTGAQGMQGEPGKDATAPKILYSETVFGEFMEGFTNPKSRSAYKPLY